MIQAVLRSRYGLNQQTRQLPVLTTVEDKLDEHLEAMKAIELACPKLL